MIVTVNIEKELRIVEAAKEAARIDALMNGANDTREYTSDYDAIIKYLRGLENRNL